MHLLPDGVAIMDDVLFLEWCNPAAERHLGLTLERDKGMRVTNLIRHPDFIDYIILGRYEQPLTLALRDRKLICHIIPFENRRQILVTHDATETERIEEMRRDFIANASHELRTPLTVIVGFLEIAMADPGLDVDHAHGAPEADDGAGQRMQRLIEDMLTLSRLESVELPAAARAGGHQDSGRIDRRRSARAVGRPAHDHGGRGRPGRDGQHGRTAQRLRQPGVERGALHAERRHDPPGLDTRPGRAVSSP